MDDLIKRLSAGERWDGDNAEVLRALGFTRVWCMNYQTGRYEDAEYYIRGETHVCRCHPLDDMNAALALVPEGWFIEHIGEDYAAGMHAVLWRRAGPSCKPVEGHGPTAAIALSIAILEARRG